MIGRRFFTVFAQYSIPTGALAGATPPASPTPAQPFANCAGVYANDYFGPLEVNEIQSARMGLHVNRYS